MRVYIGEIRRVTYLTVGLVADEKSQTGDLVDASSQSETTASDESDSFAEKDLPLKHSHKASMTILALCLPLTGVYAASSVSAGDSSFISMVSQGGMFEVEAGVVGGSQGNTQDIRDQGTTEEHDHRLVGDKLKSVASSLGINFPVALKPVFQKELDHLKAVSGPSFDALYLRDMEDIHAKDGAAFAKEAADGTNPDLRSFAAETRRIVLRHIGELKAVGPVGSESRNEAGAITPSPLQ